MGGNRLRMVPLTFIFRAGPGGVRAVVVGRQVRGAVRRNRTKRRLRELLRLNPGWFAGKYEIVIRAGEGCEKLSFRKLGEILEQAGKRLARGGKGDG